MSLISSPAVVGLDVFVGVLSARSLLAAHPAFVLLVLSFLLRSSLSSRFTALSVPRRFLAFDMRYQEPVVDDMNPFYCPALDAAAFLRDLRHQLHSGISVHIPSDCLPSFAECLDRSLDEAELQELSYRAIPQPVCSPDVSDITFSAFFCNQSTPVPRRGWEVAPPAPEVKAKRKRPMSQETFSDMLASPKKEKSIQIINESSLRVEREGGEAEIL